MDVPDSFASNCLYGTPELCYLLGMFRTRAKNMSVNGDCFTSKYLETDTVVFTGTCGDIVRDVLLIGSGARW